MIRVIILITMGMISSFHAFASDSQSFFKTEEECANEKTLGKRLDCNMQREIFPKIMLMGLECRKAEDRDACAQKVHLSFEGGDYEKGRYYSALHRISKNLDSDKGVKALKELADNGMFESILIMAELHATGQLGVIQNLHEAKRLYERALTLRDEREILDYLKPINDELKRMEECDRSDSTQLFGIKIKCASRDDLMVAVKQAGAIVKIEDKNKWGDEYDSSNILKGSSKLNIYYTLEDVFSQAEYTFPSRMDSQQVVDVKDFVSGKYGQPDSFSGNTSVGEASFTWKLKDGLTLKVSRGWPNTTTYLSFTHPENYKSMLDEQERQRRAREAKEYSKQNNAF